MMGLRLILRLSRIVSLILRNRGIMIPWAFFFLVNYARVPRPLTPASLGSPDQVGGPEENGEEDNVTITPCSCP